MARNEKLLLAVIVLVGLGLRLLDAGTRLSHDEGYSWLVATAPNASAFLSRLARYENTPPLFYLLLSPLPLHSEVWLRLPSIVAGAAAISVLHAVVRPLLGARAALLAALGLAVAPFAVSYSDYSRGFMLASLALLLALLAAARLALDGSRRWWWVYAVAAVVALYSEYYTGLYLLAIVGALLVIGRPRPRHSIVLGLAPFLTLLPWLHQLQRSQHDVGKTKLLFAALTPTPGLVRDALVPLFLGEHSVASSTALRSLEALVLVAVIAAACVVVRRRARREAFWLLAGVMLAGAVLSLLVTAVETDIFRERYLTFEIPLVAAVLAGAVSAIRARYVFAAFSVVFAVLGVGIAVRRAGREYEPDTPAAVALAHREGASTIYTNSAVVAFYGRALRVVLDRPFGLGLGAEPSCRAGCAFVDDARFGGVRPGSGRRVSIGPLVVRFPP